MTERRHARGWRSAEGPTWRPIICKLAQPGTKCVRSDRIIPIEGLPAGLAATICYANELAIAIILQAVEASQLAVQAALDAEVTANT